MSKSTKKLDKSKPYATVSGGEGVSFVQDGAHFNAKGEFVEKGDAPAEADAPMSKEDIEKGKGNIGKGQMPEFYKPLEDGGGAGGQTKSWPQGTPESEKVVEAHDAKTDDKK